ncbi:MAG: hypothetical protein DME96_07280 [Verrucomicrobia bacterium]|nr:MAG: hypothetical protein DME96_07280 [Verrucomicrobiota bacterium]
MRGKRKTHQRSKRTTSVDPGAIWRAALTDLRNELQDQCLNAKPDKQRFQRGRLFLSLMKRMDAGGGNELDTMSLCYSFVSHPSSDVGYDEPRRLPPRAET